MKLFDMLRRNKIGVQALACLVFLIVGISVLKRSIDRSHDELVKMEMIRAEKNYYTPRNKILIPLNNSYLIPNADFCRKHDPYIIAIVPSKPGDVASREAIRQTYGTSSSDRESVINGHKINHVVRFVYMVGKTDSKVIQSQLNKESSLNQDIVQIDMEDSYYNLALKVLLSLKWVDTFCPNVKFVLKIDTDVFVNVGVLLTQIHGIENSHTNTVMGRIFWNQWLDVERASDSKIGVTYEEFPLDKLPPYAQGSLYVLSRDMLPNILAVAKRMPYLHLEDVFITGVISSKINGARLVEFQLTATWENDVPKPCSFARINRLGQTKVTNNLMYMIWRALHDYENVCPQPVEQKNNVL